MRYAFDRVVGRLSGVGNTRRCYPLQELAWRQHVIHCACGDGVYGGPVSEHSVDPKDWGRRYFHDGGLDGECGVCGQYYWRYRNELLDAMELVRSAEEREERYHSWCIVPVGRAVVYDATIPFALRRRMEVCGEERERRERSQVISSMREVPSRVRVELVQLPFALQRRLPNRAC